jgi:hypothetical protein
VPAVVNISRLSPPLRPNGHGHLHYCPQVHGQAGKAIKVGDVSMCEGLLRKAESDGACLIYNFGVGTSDKFLTYLGREFKGCRVYAFDPTVSEATWAAQGGSKQVFGQNVNFHSWGLYGGDGPRDVNWSHPVYGKVDGKLYTLHEIQSNLNHTGLRISFFRSDCEGCEWEWVSRAMKDDPAMFNRIDQFWTEVHFASTLRFDEEALHRAPSFLQMINDSFIVRKSKQNNGYVCDQFKVPPYLADAGVDGRPCCLNLALVNNIFMQSGQGNHLHHHHHYHP